MDDIWFHGGYGNYVVENWWAICGPLADDDSAHLHTCNPGDTAQIVGQLNYIVPYGYLYIYGCSGSGYSSDLYVWVSIDYNTWYGGYWGQITDTEPASYSIGFVDVPFQFIAIAGYDSGMSVCLYLDAVSVVVP